MLFCSPSKGFVCRKSESNKTVRTFAQVDTSLVSFFLSFFFFFFSFLR